MQESKDEIAFRAKVARNSRCICICHSYTQEQHPGQCAYCSHVPLSEAEIKRLKMEEEEDYVVREFALSGSVRIKVFDEKTWEAQPKDARDGEMRAMFRYALNQMGWEPIDATVRELRG